MIWDWFLFQIPWQAKLAFALVALALIAIPVGNLIGWDRLRPLLIPIAALVGVLAIFNRAQQDGYNARKVQEKDAQDKAVKTVEQERADAQALDDKQLQDEVTKWTRK